MALKSVVAGSDALPAPPHLTKQMTLKEAVEEYRIPISRIRNAIKQGWLDAEIVKGKWKFCEGEFQKKYTYHKQINRWPDSRTFFIVKTVHLLVIEHFRKEFATNAAADEFEQMLNK